ncbi:MAG: AI-2E family transporter [Chloroflexi bacterium]|nr:AI-2E family transporter [Chloroflexota bacterium]
MNGWPTFYKTLIVLGTIVFAFLLYRLGETVIVLFGAIIFASAIRPVVDWLAKRGLNKSLSILLIYLVIISSILGLLIVAIPPMVGLIAELFTSENLISKIRPLIYQLAIFGWDQLHLDVAVLKPVLALPEQLQQMITQATADATAQAGPMAMSTLFSLSQIFLGLVMSFYWLTAHEMMLNLLLKMSPTRNRTRVEVIWHDIESTLGSFVRGQVILGMAIGIAAYIGLWLIRVPYALPLAVVAGLTEAIPMIGPFLGMIPAVLIGFTVSPITGLLVTGWYILIQQLESNILVPKVMEKSVGLHPLVVIVALIAGGSLNGIIGALLAVPVAGALQVIARHLLIEPVIQSMAPKVESGAVIFVPDHEADTDIVQSGPAKVEIS